MKFEFSIKSFSVKISNYLGQIINFFVLLIIVYIGFFLYQNLYTTVINPKPIDKNEVIAKKQKVNINLFNSINSKIINKQTPKTSDLDSLKELLNR